MGMRELSAALVVLSYEVILWVDSYPSEPDGMIPGHWAFACLQVLNYLAGMCFQQMPGVGEQDVWIHHSLQDDKLRMAQQITPLG